MKVRTRLAIGLLSGFAGLTMADYSWSYDQLPLGNPPKNFAEVKKEAGPLSQASKDAIKAAVEFRMGKMTEGKELPDKVRYELDGDFRTILAEDGLAVANKTALDLASKVVKGDYLPAAKINAILTIADMNEGPANARIAPYSGAIGELFGIASNPSLNNHLRSVALVGLDRHVRLSKLLNDGSKPASDKRNSIAVAMVGIINSQPSSAFEEQAHWWMVRRAYDVLLSLQAAGERAKEPLSPGLRSAGVLAMDQFNDPTQFTSIRYSAGTFLTRFDFASMKQPAFRLKVFLGVAQFLDREVVGWYENESDKAKMQSGAMGGMSGMGMMGGDMGMGMGMGGDGMMSGGGGEGGMPGGSYDGGMGGGKGAQGGPKPIDSQSWDLRIARRKLNMYTQLSHALLKGTLAKDERDYNASGKGVMEVALPESHARAGKFLIEALEEVQESINEKSLTTVSTLMARVITPLTKLRDAVELIPAYEEPDPVNKDKKIEIVKSFKDFSPRMKSFKKADASGKLDSNISAPAAGAAAAGADGAKPGDQPAASGDQPAQPGTLQPDGAAPAGQPQPAAQPGAQPAGQPAAQPAAQPGGATNPVGGQP